MAFTAPEAIAKAQAIITRIDTTVSSSSHDDVIECLGKLKADLESSLAQIQSGDESQVFFP
jgi:hypothetical protein